MEHSSVFTQYAEISPSIPKPKLYSVHINFFP